MPHRGGNKHHSGEVAVDVDMGSNHENEKVHHNSNNNYHYHHNHHHNSTNGDSSDPNITKCCVPSGCHLNNQPIRMEDLNDCVKVICNNEQCNHGRYMHKSCFESWEENVLTYLRSTGRARSWSEKQRLQNLWTKKGYDLAYKACGCKCGKGHLRKDLDWTPPVATSSDDGGKKKKNRKKKSNDKPTLIISTSMVAGGPAGAKMQQQQQTKETSSVCSTGSSHTNGHNNHHHHGQVLPITTRLRTSSMSSTGSGGSGGTSPPISGSESLSPSFDQNFMKKFFGDPSSRRERHGSGSIFSRRQDYSSFNNLPRHKINSYHIKMEDDVNHGNDETRNFILSTLSANRMNRVPCILCHTTMMIYDKYPIIDGSFFLSPQQHSKGAVAVQVDGRAQYLNAVCMGCLEGWNVSLSCKTCSTQWTGSHLILGSMYSYDIFAAVPCCTERLRCNNCKNLVISPDRRLQFFSHYSHSIPCAHCGIVDSHFAKPIQVIFKQSGRE